MVKALSVFFNQTTFQINSNDNRKKYVDDSDWKKLLSLVSNFYNTDHFNISEASPLFVTKLADNRPYISVKLHDYEITALLDSGYTFKNFKFFGKKNKFSARQTHFYC